LTGRLVQVQLQVFDGGKNFLPAIVPNGPLLHRAMGDLQITE